MHYPKQVKKIKTISKKQKYLFANIIIFRFLVKNISPTTTRLNITLYIRLFANNYRIFLDALYCTILMILPKKKSKYYLHICLLKKSTSIVNRLTHIFKINSLSRIFLKIKNSLYFSLKSDPKISWFLP